MSEKISLYVSLLTRRDHGKGRGKKQNLRSETWIEQVKGYTMAGNTLTDDFWANDILWQLSVFAFNISVPAKITRSGHHIELKMYEHHFYKDAWEELDRLIEAA